MNSKNTNGNKRTRFATLVIAVSAAVLAASAFAGCDHVDGWRSVEKIDVNHQLQSFASCDDFESYAVQAATQLMRARIEAERDMWDDYGGGDVAAGDAEGDVDSDADGDGDADNATEGDHSETNVQEQGVDEGDLVKTDGEHIFALHAGELVIVEADAEGDLAHAGRAEVGGYANELFIYEDIAVVFSTLYDSDVPSDLRYTFGATDSSDYDCWDGWCYGSTAYTQIALVDISDRSAPSVTRTVIFGGEYVTSRRIDGSVRVVVYSPILPLEMSWDWETGDDMDWSSESEVNDYYEHQIEYNEERFEDVTLEQIMPKKLDSADGEVTAITECGFVMGPVTPSGIGLSTIISMSLDAPADPLATVAVFGSRGLVYASPTGLYLTTSPDYLLQAWDSGMWSDETSGIHKFDISMSDSAAFYMGTGAVAGRLLNQFSMGEKDGYLRVATTSGSNWDTNDLENHVFVLSQEGEELVTVGHLGGLGMGEEIYAARFIGDRGFLVTFFQTDPLFTLDLSDPTDPQAVGEWLGPGYSTYLHPIDEDHLLAIGEEDWQVALSLYDLSDFSSPALVERELWGYDEYSAAVYEHKAFLFNEETGLLALPFYGWDSSYETYHTGIRLYDVDATGIAQTGNLELIPDGLDSYEAEARRSLYIGGSIFGVSRCRITSGAIADPDPTIDSLTLFTGDACEDDGYGYGYESEEGWD